MRIIVKPNKKTYVINKEIYDIFINQKESNCGWGW